MKTIFKFVFINFLFFNFVIAKVPRQEIRISGNVDVKLPSSFKVNYLEGLKITKADVYDPYQKNEKITFEGILLEDLFKHFSPASKTAKVVAINGYQVVLSRDAQRSSSLLFAFKSNSEYIDVKKMGPLRIVRINAGQISEQELILEGVDWVWMVKEIIFE